MEFKWYSLLFAIGAIFAFSTCNYILDPIDVVPVSLTVDTTKRIALLEEWTGHVCTNCPDAAREIDLLKSTYGDRFIAISIHDGYFAEPCTGGPNPVLPPCAVGVPGAFQDDFTCAIGASYSAAHPDGPNGPPTGMINRIGMPGSELNSYGAWASVVDALVAQNASTSAHIVHTYNSTARLLNVQVWGTWMQAYTGNVNVAIMLTESNKVGWQIDDQVCVANFVFNDILRECMNTPGSITGSQVSANTSVIGSTWSYTLPSGYVIPGDFNAANCHIVAIIYDTTTGEVLQAWEEDVQ